jgi:predicted dienelactone hydrolase
MWGSLRVLAVFCSCGAIWISGALAQPAGQEFKPPEDIDFRKATIVSEGTRMAAEVYAPKNAGQEKLPTIVMAHGWGGVAAHLRPDAVAFARAGYLVVRPKSPRCARSSTPSTRRPTWRMP